MKPKLIFTVYSISTLEFKITVCKIGVLSSLMWYIGLEWFEIMTNSCYLFSNKLIMFLIVICSWFTALITAITPELWFTYWLLHQTNTSTTYLLIISTCIYLNSYALLILWIILLLLIRLTTLILSRDNVIIMPFYKYLNIYHIEFQNCIVIINRALHCLNFRIQVLPITIL